MQASLLQTYRPVVLLYTKDTVTTVTPPMATINLIVVLHLLYLKTQQEQHLKPSAAEVEVVFHVVV